MPSRRIVAALFFVAVLILLAFVVPTGGEWDTIFMRAGQAVLHGENPYRVPGFYSPPHLLLLLVPLSVLPVNASNALHLLLMLGGAVLVAARLGAGRIAVGALLLSPFVLVSAWANVDLLVIVGLVVPTYLALPLLLVKPQLGALVILYLVIAKRRTSTYPRFILSGAIVAALWIVGLALWGTWPLAAFASSAQSWNAALFPYALPVGIALALVACRRHRIAALPLAALLASPYVWLPSWFIALPLAVVRHPRLVIAVTALAWVFAVWQVARG